MAGRMERSPTSLARRSRGRDEPSAESAQPKALGAGAAQVIRDNERERDRAVRSVAKNGVGQQPGGAAWRVLAPQAQ